MQVKFCEFDLAVCKAHASNVPNEYRFIQQQTLPYIGKIKLNMVLQIGQKI